jgi:hypothetical protein
MEQVKSQAEQSDQARQPYQRPELVNHGKVEQVTQVTAQCPSRPIYVP